MSHAKTAWTEPPFGFGSATVFARGKKRLEHEPTAYAHPQGSWNGLARQFVRLRIVTPDFRASYLCQLGVINRQRIPVSTSESDRTTVRDIRKEYLPVPDKKEKLGPAPPDVEHVA